MNHVFSKSAKSFFLAAMMVATAWLLPACEGRQTSDADLTILDYETMVKAMKDPKIRTVVVDVRKPEDFNKGHIPGAINIPVLDLYYGDPRLSQAQAIIVYSNGWSPRQDDLLSWAASKKLLAVGYDYVDDFRGGLSLWAESGGKVVIPDQGNRVETHADVEVTEDGINITQLDELERGPAPVPTLREEVEADVNEAIKKQD